MARAKITKGARSLCHRWAYQIYSNPLNRCLNCELVCALSSWYINQLLGYFSEFCWVSSLPVPLRPFRPTSQNIRVSTIDAPSIEGDVVDNAGDVINRCYRQIYFHAMSSDRDRYLESQLRNGSITVRDFIRGLLLSDRFMRGYVACSNNYRLVEQVIGRALGRKVRDNTEKLTYSIVIAEKGFESFVDLVLNSEEYMQRFGYDTVPLEISRVLPGRAVGEAPVYQEFPRYSYDWQEKLISNDMMMSIEDHLNFGPTKSFAEKVLYERPSDKAFRYIIPSFVILSGLIVVGVVKVFTSVFVVG